MDELAGDSRSADSPPCRLPDDFLLEILLRLPPEPIYLHRASFVSKHWRGLVHDARFLRRFREFHGGAPPVLGFFNNPRGPPLFVPTSAGFAPSTPTMSRDCWICDCRHGRVLVDTFRAEPLLVWDVMTGDERSLPFPPQAHRGRSVHSCAVLCAAGHADRGVCRSCPFLVPFVFSSHTDFITRACVYSSETGVWGEITSFQIPGLSVAQAAPKVLVGNTLYWLLNHYNIMEFDLDKHSLDLTGNVPLDALDIYHSQTTIMNTEDGGLGFANVDGFNLHLWSMVATNDGLGSWTHCRVIDLEKLLAPEIVAEFMVEVAPVGYAEDAHVIFIDVGPSVYMIYLKSMRIEKVPKKGTRGYLFPYTSFYAPGITIGGGDDQDELLNDR